MPKRFFYNHEHVRWLAENLKASPGKTRTDVARAFVAKHGGSVTRVMQIINVYCKKGLPPERAAEIFLKVQQAKIEIEKGRRSVASIKGWEKIPKEVRTIMMSDMGKKAWEGTTKGQRSREMSRRLKKIWKPMSPEERRERMKKVNEGLQEYMETRGRKWSFFMTPKQRSKTVRGRVQDLIGGNIRTTHSRSRTQRQIIVFEAINGLPAIQQRIILFRILRLMTIKEIRDITKLKRIQVLEQYEAAIDWLAQDPGILRLIETDQ